MTQDPRNKPPPRPAHRSRLEWSTVVGVYSSLLGPFIEPDAPTPVERELQRWSRVIYLREQLLDLRQATAPVVSANRRQVELLAIEREIARLDDAIVSRSRRHIDQVLCRVRNTCLVEALAFVREVFEAKRAGESLIDPERDLQSTLSQAALLLRTSTSRLIDAIEIDEAAVMHKTKGSAQAALLVVATLGPLCVSILKKVRRRMSAEFVIG